MWQQNSWNIGGWLDISPNLLSLQLIFYEQFISNTLWWTKQSFYWVWGWFAFLIVLLRIYFTTTHVYTLNLFFFLFFNPSYLNSYIQSPEYQQNEAWFPKAFCLAFSEVAPLSLFAVHPTFPHTTCWGQSQSACTLPTTPSNTYHIQS